MKLIEDKNTDAEKFAYLKKDERFLKVLKVLGKIFFILSIVFGLVYLTFCPHIFVYGTCLVFLMLTVVSFMVFMAINSTVNYVKHMNMTEDEYFEFIKKQYNEMYHRY